MHNGIQSNYIKIQDGQIDAKLDVFLYENDGFKIAYAPALDLMGYGKTDEDAKTSFQIVIEDFFETSIEKNTLAAYLASHGWSGRTTTEFRPPLPVPLMEQNHQLQEIFLEDSFVKQTVPFRYAFAC